MKQLSKMTGGVHPCGEVVGELPSLEAAEKKVRMINIFISLLSGVLLFYLHGKLF